ncbi:hypothetical protein Patl1_21035 [Pistacia atlantica]|uniref:Uncharacterized protein n=1 Tax=Pistacia atlantica TaxID=434234 RepID=A0ACC1BLA9_9ROSI|nr:hypothetical protein Patl1_21035 [Pistacia atlantica]
MNSCQLSLQWRLLSVFIIFSISVTATNFNIPRLSPIRGSYFMDLQILSTDVSEDFQTFFYTQTLDHFNYRPESFSTFQQLYLINFKSWGGANANAPIFAYFGAEGPLDGDLDVIGFLTDNANRFNALLVYIEAEDSPVIVIGGSYGGMLAAWFRLKYPHAALGALASSAPILYFDDITPQNGYYSVVTKDFREASETCYQTIRESWSEIEKIASTPNGLLILSKQFRTCKPLQDSSELKDNLLSMYATAAQYNQPPRYPVSMVCGGIDGAPSQTDILGKIFAGVVAFKGNRSCYINAPMNESETDVGWQWQTCSEIVIPIGIDNTTMFPPNPFNLSVFIDGCEAEYSGVHPRPHWVTTYYGGHNIKLILQRFASNIIFSNGLRDPYSSGGVLEDISDTVVAIHTVNGSHCLDILRANRSSDPDWLVKQRETELEIIEGWMSMYYADLKASKQIQTTLTANNSNGI